jgi:hypothetical protein
MASHQDSETTLVPVTVRHRHTKGATSHTDMIARRALIGVVSSGAVAAVLSIAGPSSFGGQVGEAKRRRRRRRRKRSSKSTMTATPTPTPTPTPTQTS